MEVLSHAELPIRVEDDVSRVRRLARELAEARKFDRFANAAITTAVSELARNVLVHARGGAAIVEELSDGRSVGLRVVFRDEGPGIADIDRVLRGGYSTANSMGLGLSGSKRLVDEFDLVSKVGEGTTVTVVKWKRF